MGRTLALNKSFLPIRIVGLQSTICKFYDGRVEGMYINGDTWEPKMWDEWLEMSKKDIWPEGTQFINSVTQRIAVPRVIRFLYYDKIPKVTFRLSRKSIYDRDNNTCYLCGKKFGESKLSIDHIRPLSRGGGNSWENMVTCCVECNWKKGDKTLEELKLKPKFMPYKPQMSNIQKLKAGVKTYDPVWKMFGF